MIENRKTMSDAELRRALDYQVGDIVQLKPDGKEFSGQLGVIIGISTCKEQNPEKGCTLSYRLKLSDSKGIAVAPRRIRLVRAAGNDKVMSETESHFLPNKKRMSVMDCFDAK